MAQLKAFWDWFYEYREAYYYLQDFTERERDYYYHELDLRLTAYHPSLSFIIKFGNQNKKAELILTANGKADGMFYVSNLISIVPEIPKWKISGFIKPSLDIEAIKKGKDAPYKLQELDIKPSDIRWAPVDIDPNTYKYDLVFYLKTYPHFNQTFDEDRLLDYIYMILLDLLGEMYVSKTIGMGYYENEWIHIQDWYRLENLKEFLETGEVDFI